MLEHRALEALNEGLMEKADTPVVIARNQISYMVVNAIGILRSMRANLTGDNESEDDKGVHFGCWM